MGKENELHIAVLIKRFIATGGAERYAVEVTRRLRDRGHRIDLYARQVDDQLTDGLRVTRIPDTLRFSSVLNSWSFARQTAKHLAARAYDVILSHERGYCQDLATIHTFSYRLGLEDASFLKKLSSLYLSPRSWLHLRLERQQMESAWLAPVSNIIQTGIGRYYGRNENMAVATPGVDIDWFNPHWVADHRADTRRAEEIVPGEMAVLFVGSEFKRKGLDNLIRAISPEMKLLVVGQGERLGYYQRLIEQRGLSGRVIFKGLVNDVRRYYAAADVVVLPSRKEAFGMSILEAMACGLPVISSAAAGVADLIEDGQNGFVFHQPAQIGALLQTLAAPDMRRTLGYEARLTAETHTWDQTAACYEVVCRKIAAQKSGRVAGDRA